MEASGVMDRVEVVSILQKNSPLAGISGGGLTISVLLVYKCIYVNTKVNVSNYTFDCSF
jgi:hypothetical protein